MFSKSFLLIIYGVIYGIFTYFTISCVSMSGHLHEKKPLDEPYEQVYRVSFEKAWKAAQITMKNYPLKVNDLEQGVLETGWIKRLMYWKPTYEKKTSRFNSSEVLRYRIKVQVVEEEEEEDSEIGEEDEDFEKEHMGKKGRSGEDESEDQEVAGDHQRGQKSKSFLDVKRGNVKTRVFVLKTIHKKSDFFSDALLTESDGIEEQVILYRIKREIDIAKRLDQEFN